MTHHRLRAAALVLSAAALFAGCASSPIASSPATGSPTTSAASTPATPAVVPPPVTVAAARSATAGTTPTASADAGAQRPDAAASGAAVALGTEPLSDAARAEADSLAASRAAAALADAEPAPVPVPVDPLRPGARIDPDDRSAQMDLWARARRGFAIPDLSTDLVRSNEQWYATRPDYVARMTGRSSRYLFHILEETDKRGMPSELALLPFIESAFNPQAMSVAKASGMWQFIPSTGKDYDLKQNVFRDDRRDVLASTRAALDHLARLYTMFGDWHLALAAYNWGEGNVQRAITRNQRAGLPTDYLSLSMPEETRQYVPKLQAVKNIIARPDAFGLTLPPAENHPYFLSVPIERDIDVALAANLAGLDVDEFKALNPQMNRPVILAAGTPQVLLPYDNANRFVRAVPGHRGAFATWTAWVAPRTLRPAEAAKRVGMSEASLRAVNNIPPKMLVKAGSTLLVPRAASHDNDVSVHLADNATLSLAPDAPPLRRVAVRAGKRGSTVASLAKTYRVSAAQLAQWNHVSVQAAFKPGQSVVLYLPGRAPKSSHATRTARAKAPHVVAKAKTATRTHRATAQSSPRKYAQR